MPWLSHPTVTGAFSATPLSGIHQRDRQLWVAGLKVIKGLTQNKVGNADPGVDFYKCSPCTANAEVTRGTC